MTELPPASLHSIRWTVTLAPSFGWFFDAYVITIYALTVPLIAAEFHLATNILSGAIGSIFRLGYTIRPIGFSVCADRFGRRVMLGASIVGYGVVTFHERHRLARCLPLPHRCRRRGRVVHRQPLCHRGLGPQ